MREVFRKFNLNEKESSTFLLLLELGAQPISVIAKQMKIPRSTMYTIIDKLVESKLVENFEKAGIRYVKCIPVDQIINVLKARERDLKQTINTLNVHLPQLKALENTLSHTPTIKYHEGQERVVQLYESILGGVEFCAFFNPELVKHRLPQYYYGIAETVAKHQLLVREIVTDSKTAREYQEAYQSKNYQIKILKKSRPLPSDTIICKNKIYMISYGEKDMVGIEIINQSLSQSQQVMFDQLWDLL